MNINRSVVLNPIEPSQLSFRAPIGMPSNLNVNFFGQDGRPYSSDVGGQLQLTGRSTARTATYWMYATDIANGRARAVLPADALSDPNGYRLRLVGTINGEPMLMALGTVVSTAAAGLEAMPVDLIDTIDLTFERGSPAELQVKLWQDVGKSIPIDLSAVTVTAAIYENRGGAQLVPFTVATVSGNEVLLTLDITQVDALPDSCWWSLVTSGSTGATTQAEGAVTVSDP